MKLIKCPNGHFYDAERFGSCPHCEEKNESRRPGSIDNEMTDFIPAPPVPEPIAPEPFLSGPAAQEPFPSDPDLRVKTAFPFSTTPVFDNWVSTVKARNPEDQVIRTDVCSADIYLSGGIVRRRGSADLREGENTLYITGISSSAVKDSIRLIPVDGGKRETVQVLDYLPPLKQPEAAPETDEKIKELNDRLLRLQREAEIKLNELQIWQDIMNNLSDIQCDIKDLPAFLEEYSTKICCLQREKKKLELDMVELQKQINALQNPLPDGKTQSIRVFELCVYAKVLADAPGPFSFMVEYREPQMGWKPMYEVEAVSLAEPVRIIQQAKLRQMTGETWTDTAVKLFTNAPSVSTGFPEYKPVYLSLAPKEPKPKWRPLNRSMPMYDAASPDDEMFLSGSTPTTGMGFPAPAASLVQPGFEVPGPDDGTGNASASQTAEYALSGAVTLDSGPEGRLFDLRTIETPAGYCCYVYPKYSARGYLTAILPDAAQFELLKGNAEMYCEGKYLGKGVIDPDKIDGDYELLLGMDDQIRVSRRLMKKNHASGDRWGTEKNIYEYEITVTSMKRHAVNLIVMDQIPVSQDENITVRLLDMSGGELNEKTGGIRWEMPLAPGRTIPLTLSWEVSSPVKRQICET